jgi:hypothetical protein
MDRPKTEVRYEISVWNFEGDVVRKLWDASEAELEAVRAEFADDPVDVVIDRDWEVRVYDEEDV